MSFDALFAANGIAFLVSADLVAVTLPRPVARERESGVLGNLPFGLSIYLATPRLRGLLAPSMAAAAAGATIIVNTVVYVRERLGGSESESALAFEHRSRGKLGQPGVW